MWIVCGINNHSIQRRLLAEQTLTYVRAIKLAQRLEIYIDMKTIGTSSRPAGRGILENRQGVAACVQCGPGKTHLNLLLLWQAWTSVYKVQIQDCSLSLEEARYVNPEEITYPTHLQHDIQKRMQMTVRVMGLTRKHVRYSPIEVMHG